ncbi:unnamed protein product [Haemonchus placei]|uniref:Uncharacterized protein n=1 Tax=Haemonchus placei TaxID=6290 RepID=A0A3P8AF35_HAEPC|nr:unnamed protein product [Haemonchus placei]
MGQEGPELQIRKNEGQVRGLIFRSSQLLSGNRHIIRVDLRSPILI